MLCWYIQTYAFLIIPLSEPVKILIFDSGYVRMRSSLMVTVCRMIVILWRSWSLGRLYWTRVKPLTTQPPYVAGSSITCIDLFVSLLWIPTYIMCPYDEASLNDRWLTSPSISTYVVAFFMNSFEKYISMSFLFMVPASTWLIKLSHSSNTLKSYGHA